MPDLEKRIKFRGRVLGRGPAFDDVYEDIDLRLGDLKEMHILFGTVTLITKDGKIYTPEETYPRLQNFCDAVGIEYEEPPPIKI